MATLITGGTGYIGSHTALELLKNGREVLLLDNFSNSSRKVPGRLKELSGKEIPIVECDLRDRETLEKVFKENSIDSVIHFAGLKSVSESCLIPLEYYDNNLGGTITLCEVMKKYGCNNIVFSSSATVYGSKNTSPLREDMPIGGTTNPYGTTKYFIEQILTDTAKADKNMSVCLLRYFNPLGANERGLIGEDPNGIPNNLMPYVTQVSVGKLPYLKIYGNDYDTPDGTGVRDYIHVVDLAKGHISALDKTCSVKGVNIYNLGTGRGYSVLEVIKAFEKASGITIPYKILPRRSGDIATCYSDPSKAERELGWKAEKGIDEMCADSYRWQKNNPNGYGD